MNTKTSPIHSLVHVVMLIIIVGLLSLYFQLQSRYEELALSCHFMEKTARDTKEYCSGDGHTCAQQGHSSLATSPLHFSAPTSPSQAVLNNGGKYSGTGLAAGTTDSIFSISHSLFDSTGAPFETSQAMMVDEFGKTQRGVGSLEVFSTDDTTDLIRPSVTSSVEITKAEALKVDSLPDQRKNNEKKLSTVRNLPVQPSATTENVKRQNGAFKVYDQAQYSSESESTSLSTSNNKLSSITSETLFDEDTLLIASATTENLLRSTEDQPVIDKGSFGLTHSDGSSEDNGYRYAGDSIFSTDIPSEDETFCKSEKCEGNGDVESGVLNIQPMRLKDLSDDNSSSEEESDNNGSNTKDRNENGISVTSLLKLADTKELHRLERKGTSSWCQTVQENGSTSCLFQNLCYNTAEHDFMFLKGDESVIDTQTSLSIPSVNAMPDISLSTARDHNALMLSLVFIPAESLHKFSSVAILEKRAFVMSRFKPDNIMHVLHDDILPLLHTFRHKNLLRNSDKSDVAILFTDQFDSSDFGKFYSSLSTVSPAPLRTLNKTADVICLNEAYVGLSNSTLWYQYGFFKPQGPLKVRGSEVMAITREGVSYLTKHLHSTCLFCKNGKYLVLLSRKDNRLMLNEGELMLSLARAMKLKIMSVSLETHTAEDIISIVRDSRGIVGMHGSLLIYVIFLQPGSIVIELFPHAVNPSKYTPFKTFCDFPKSGIVYKSWANLHRDKSIPHPYWSPEMGGIQHLPRATQENIIRQSEVPDHLCCKDPSWLYHIYQDTEVDIEAVTSLTVDALAEADNLLQKKRHPASQMTKDVLVRPGPVRELTCKGFIQDSNGRQKFRLTWKFPWNLEFMSYNLLQSHLVIQEKDRDDSVNVELPSDVQTYSFEPSEKNGLAAFNVWIRVTADHTLNGPYSFVACHSDR